MNKTRDAKGRFVSNDNDNGDSDDAKKATDWNEAISWCKTHWVLLLIWATLVVVALLVWRQWEKGNNTNITAPATASASPATPVSTTVPTVAQATPVSTTVPSGFPLAGTRYEGYVNGQKNSAYDAVWTADGRLWQPHLPEANNRQAHSVAFTLVQGTYTFNGVECTLKLDEQRSGDAVTIIDRANGYKFEVDPKPNTDGQAVAWGVCECRGNPSTGFEIVDP